MKLWCLELVNQREEEERDSSREVDNLSDDDDDDLSKDSADVLPQKKVKRCLLEFVGFFMTLLPWLDKLTLIQYDKFSYTHDVSELVFLLQLFEFKFYVPFLCADSYQSFCFVFIFYVNK